MKTCFARFLGLSSV